MEWSVWSPEKDFLTLLENWKEPRLTWECLSLISLNLTGKQKATTTAEDMDETVQLPAV